MSTIHSNSYEGVPKLLNPFTGSVTTIGNFDGCHLGHQKLIASSKQLAAQRQLICIGLTFEPAPEVFFLDKGQSSNKNAPPLFNSISAKRLFTVKQKARAFTELGVDVLVIEEFNDRLSKMTHAEFFKEVLDAHLKAKALVVGDDFRFGFKREGDVQYLKKMFAKESDVLVCDPIYLDKQIVSSTRIRNDILNGQVEKAQILLGRPYLLEGMIGSGQKRGRKLGIPTANLTAIEQVIPCRGVYCGFVHLVQNSEKPSTLRLSRAAVPAVFNIGFQPTVNSDNTLLQVEAHLLSGTYDAEGLYGVSSGYYFTHRLRDEQKFPDLDSLKSAIGKDIERAKILLKDFNV